MNHLDYFSINKYTALNSLVKHGLTCMSNCGPGPCFQSQRWEEEDHWHPDETHSTHLHLFNVKCDWNVLKHFMAFWRMKESLLGSAVLTVYMKDLVNYLWYSSSSSVSASLWSSDPQHQLRHLNLNGLQKNQNEILKL